MYTRCRDCREMKLRIWNGRRDKRGKKIYTEGLNGKLWAWKQCPDCKYLPKNRGVAVTKDVDLGPLSETNPLTSRKCRICDVRLRADRYFHCASCTVDHDDFTPEDYGCGINFNGAPSHRVMLSDWSYHG